MEVKTVRDAINEIEMLNAVIEQLSNPKYLEDTRMIAISADYRGFLQGVLGGLRCEIMDAQIQKK